MCKKAGHQAGFFLLEAGMTASVTMTQSNKNTKTT
jgi:hypothetical protein